MFESVEHQPDAASLLAEIQQGVTEDSPASNSQSDSGQVRHEDSVPYERFQQVNERARTAESKYTELLEQLSRQQAASQGQGYAQAQQTGQNLGQQARELLTAEEIEYFNQNALIDPGGSMRQLTDLIYERGIRHETERVKQELRQEFGAVAQNFAQQIAPMAINSYKQTAFNTPVYQSALPIFEEMLAQEMRVNPGVVNNPDALNTLRTLALGKAAETGKLQFSSSQQNLPFSENPGSPLSGMFPNNTTVQADPRAVSVGKLLGIDPKVINKTHEVFQRNGVYRND